MGDVIDLDTYRASRSSRTSTVRIGAGSIALFFSVAVIWLVARYG